MQRYLSNLIAVNGLITLDEFISTAMCHPFYGYYAKQNPIKKDFITSPEITNAFGIVIANFIINKLLTLKNLDATEEIHLVEFGGGSGKLAFDVLSFIFNLNKLNNKKINSVIKKISFHSIEFSSKLKLIQKNKLKNISLKKYFWNNISEFDECLKSREVCQNNIFVFLSNEFFDALPIKQFVRNEGSFFEIIVTEKDNNFIFEKIKINSDKLKLIPENIKLIKNDIIELPIVGMKIIEDIVKLIQKNKFIFLAFDYGFVGGCNESTLQGICRGVKTSNILKNVGDTDITHLVNFELLLNAFYKYNIKPSIQTQREFLVANGINSVVNRENKIGIDRIIDASQMGNLFKMALAERL
ncbi:MAG: NADH dehydrogenase [ubiquinone] 1 alpha subcomplex assembly factor 7 [Candidatus Deianiraeaceae bacterium]|jgi:NADH dehydrogenase [ubiquinone] 1 alpha subcomplex assembly factor 7